MRASKLAMSLLMALAVAACGSSTQSQAPGAAGSAPPAGSPQTGVSGPGLPGSSGAASASGGSAQAAPAQGGPAPATSAPGAPAGGASTGNVALDLQAAFVSVVNKVSPSVVVVETSEGLGSGVVFDTRGDIVTNAHVVGTSTTFKVSTSSGERLNATLVGTFASDDLAVIRADGGSLPPATFGDSSRLVVGDIVMAIGNPLGLQSSVTEGIVSAVGRTVAEPGGAALPDVIQTSAPINPGNSGGALVSLAGEVIGIPTLTATDPQIGGAAPGIGFAVSSNTAKDIATQLIEHGKVVSSHRAYLGIRAANVTGAPGVLVFSVDPGGPAAKAGIPADVLITSIDGKATPDQPSLATVLAGLTPGQTVPVVIERQDGSTQTVRVTLGELPG